jgi:DNA-binding LacI/PurR family transcriptional regulator
VVFLSAQESSSGKGDLFAAAAAARGLDTTVLHWREGGEDTALGAGLAREALNLSPRPTALIGRTDAVALGALHAVREAGLRVPEDISLAGYYDFTFSPYLSPSLTTVYTPFRECAVTVLTAALEALGREPFVPPPPRLISLPVGLRVRGSTGPAPA